MLLSRYKLPLLISICLNYSVVLAQLPLAEQLVRLDEDEASILGLLRLTPPILC